MNENDFKNQYKKEMNNEAPSYAALEKLNALSASAENEKTSSQAKLTPRFWRKCIAVAACLALIAVACVPIIGMMKPKKPITPTPSGKEGNTLTTPPDYSEIYKVISAAKEKYYVNGSYDLAEKAIPESTVPGDTKGKDTAKYSDESADSLPDYSDTNIQVEGVMEADVVKTDGKYIYALSTDYLYIISAKDGKLELTSKISRSDYPEDDSAPKSFREMYISGNRLVVIKNIYEKVDENIDLNGNGIPDKDEVRMKWYYSPYRSVGIGAEIFDISDKENPKSLNTLSQSGDYISSRMIGSVLYLVSNYGVYNNYDTIDEARPETFVPQIKENGKSKALAPDCIYMNSDVSDYESSAYIVISGIDTAGNGEIVSTKSVFGYGSTVYSSNSSLYLTDYVSDFEDNGNTYSNGTKILRFALDRGNVEFKAEGKVPGNILNQFSMDEYNGIFRIVTTVYSYKTKEVTDGTDTWTGYFNEKQSNALYTLDASLNVIGKLENVANDERVYSVRFDGDIGYFVTFKQVDPLFAVDLSNPENPKILSALKIPGFSEYLHPYTVGRLFGLGKNSDGVKSGFLKLSMFDTSDKKDVTEKYTLTIDGAYYSPASYNHKAILINGAKNIIAFPVENKYLVYSYTDENGFIKEAEITFNDYENYYDNNIRGMFIGDYLYIVSSFGIVSFDMSDYETVDKVEFEPPYRTVESGPVYVIYD